MEPNISVKKQIITGILGTAAFLFILWLVNGPIMNSKVERIMKEQMPRLTMLPTGEDAAIRFVDQDGVSRTLADYAGTPLLMNIWATWCPPCIAEMPVLADIDAEYGDKLNVIAISIDQQGFEKIEEFLTKNPIEHPPLFHDADKRLFRHLRIKGLPTSFVINAQGQTVAKLERSIEAGDEELITLLDEVVKKTEPVQEPNASSR